MYNSRIKKVFARQWKLTTQWSYGVVGGWTVARCVPGTCWWYHRTGAPCCATRRCSPAPPQSTRACSRVCHISSLPMLTWYLQVTCRQCRLTVLFTRAAIVNESTLTGTSHLLIAHARLVPTGQMTSVNMTGVCKVNERASLAHLLGSYVRLVRAGDNAEIVPIMLCWHTVILFNFVGYIYGLNQVNKYIGRGFKPLDFLRCQIKNVHRNI